MIETVTQQEKNKFCIVENIVNHLLGREFRFILTDDAGKEYSNDMYLLTYLNELYATENQFTFFNRVQISKFSQYISTKNIEEVPPKEINSLYNTVLSGINDAIEETLNKLNNVPPGGGSISYTELSIITNVDKFFGYRKDKEIVGSYYELTEVDNSEEFKEFVDLVDKYVLNKIRRYNMKWGYEYGC